MIKKVKGQAIEWEKIFANHISDKGLGIRIDKLYICIYILFYFIFETESLSSRLECSDTI